jgi:8-oxo-dGTP pyrophosphatase MutT (NUDIX family)
MPQMPEAAGAPVMSRPAATVMVLQPRGDGFEVFMVRRHQASKFAADVYVFPGGTVRPDDRLDEDQARAVGLDPAALNATLAAHDDPFAAEADGGLSLWVAALRELFEEAGLLLAEDKSGRFLDLSDPGRAAHFQTLRGELQYGRLSLDDLAQAEGLRLLADHLVYFSRWITPATSPRRFDTRFLVAELPLGQTAAHCQIETTEGLWISPGEALARQADGDFPMMSVTREHIRRLAEFRRTETLLEFARGRRTSLARAVVDATREPHLAPEQRRTW